MYSGTHVLRKLQHKAIVIYHHQWSTAAPNVQSELQSRGYTVSYTDDATVGLHALEQASASLGKGDYLVVYLAGHGYNPRNYGDSSKATALGHWIQFNSGTLSVQQMAPLFEQAAQKGVNLTVIDGSCNGGETVLNAMGQPYCAMSTTGVFSPGLTNFPDPSTSMHRDTNPGEFGFWWDTPHMTASWMNGDIVSHVPERINQRLFRNDNTHFAKLSLFLRSSIGFLTGLDLGGWNLHYQYCYLYRFIYPDEYAALSQSEKKLFKSNLQTYLATMHTGVDAAAPLFAKLGVYLNDHELLWEAAKVYGSQYTQVWQTLAGDPNWNVEASPGTYASQMKGLSPDAYKGKAGFLKIADEIESLMSILQSGFQQQETLLKEIDAAVKDLYRAYPLPDTRTRVMKRVWPPAPGKPTLEFNTFERAMMEKVKAVDRDLKIDRSLLVQPALREVRATPVRLSPQVREVEAQKSIERGIVAYQDSFKTVLSDRTGISSATLNPLKRQRIEDLVAKFKAVSPTLYYAEGRISFLLAILEDAVDKVQNGITVPCQVPF